MARLINPTPYTYYDNGLKKTYTGPEGVTYTYAYNDNNQLTEVRIPGHGSITHTSYNWTRPEAITLPGGATKSYVYDPLMRVKQITSADPGQNVMVDYQYDYDRMDNITTRATEHGEYVYGYDDLYRLINADNPMLSDEAFTYDPVGNRITSADTTTDWTTPITSFRPTTASRFSMTQTATRSRRPTARRSPITSPTRKTGSSGWRTVPATSSPNTITIRSAEDYGKKLTGKGPGSYTLMKALLQKWMPQVM